MSRNIVVFGDSYGAGGSQSGKTYRSYAQRLKERIPGCDKVTNISESGRGFVSKSDFTGLTFAQCIDAQNRDTKVTDVIIAGGYNDRLQCNKVRTAMADAIGKAKGKYPSARIYVAFIGWSWFAVEYGLLSATCRAYQDCQQDGASFMTNCNWVMHNLSLFDSDHIHPNAQGHIRLADAMAQVLTGATPDIIENEVQITWDALHNNIDMTLFCFAENGIGTVSRRDPMPLFLRAYDSRLWCGSNRFQITKEASSGFFRGYDGVAQSIPCNINIDGKIYIGTATLVLINGAWYFDAGVSVDGQFYTGKISDLTILPFSISFSRCNN